ncbi:MAG: hypothetical protein ACKOQ4_02860 [Mycobacterium sp.]
MSVGEEVQSSLDHWSAQQWRNAMWHATAALDETAAKRHPSMDTAARFRRTVREDVDVFGAMAGAEIDFSTSRLPLPVHSDLPDGRPDIADVLWAVHRYLHEDESVMAAGCQISPHAEGVPLFDIHSGRLWLRASAALGLLAIAVFSPENKGEPIPGDYHLGWQQHTFHVVGWWGWRDHFREIVRNAAVPQYELDFGAEWEVWGPVG